MKTDKIIEDLESIITSGLESVVLPYKKGNSIRLKNYIIRQNSNGYQIYDCQINKRIAQTYFKTSAVAIVKNLIEGKNIVDTTLTLDRELLKHYNDVLFFRNTIKKSSNKMVRESRQARLGVSIDKTRHIKEKIDNFIF